MPTPSPEFTAGVPRARLPAPSLWLSLALAWPLALAAPGAEAAVVTAGTPLTQWPAALQDPLGSLAAGLGADQFLVPVWVQDAVALDLWQFSLQFDATVALPTDAGGLFQSVYGADFGDGTVSQITASGLLLDGLLQDVSGWFAPGVSGDGPLAYVLFQYQPGHEGQDPQATVPGEPAPIPEPASLALVLAALTTARWAGTRRHARLPSTSMTPARSGAL